MMDLNVRNIQSYNKEIKKNDESGVSKIYTPTEGNTEKYHQKLPYIVVVVDEFAEYDADCWKESRRFNYSFITKG